MKTAAICVVKNARFRIAEWIAYQIAVGFDTVILLDNASTDGTAQVIGRLAPFCDVRLIDWPMTGPTYQMKGFEYALWAGRAEFDWCACIDVDEFIVPAPSEDIKDIVGRAPQAAAAIAMPWAMFGSNGHLKTPADLVIEAYTRRAPMAFWVNRHIKSLVKPDAVAKCISSHLFDVAGDYVDAFGQVIREPTAIMPKVLSYDGGKIHHYFVQSRQCWDQKISRGYHDMSRSSEEFDAYDRNQEEDHAARRFSSAVKAILSNAGLIDPQTADI